MEKIHAKEVVEQAFTRFGTPEIVNADRGTPNADPMTLESFAAQTNNRLLLKQLTYV